MTINYHTVVKLPQITGIPADAAENTFSWIMPGTLLLTDMTEIHSALAEFYNTVVGGAANAIAQYLGDQLSRATGACSMTTYVIPPVGGHLGAPVDVSNFTLGPTAGTSTLPSELAACLSFRGDYGSAVEFAPGQRPRARLRGRIYLGPLGNNAPGVSQRDATTKRENFVSGFRFDVTQAAARLRDRTASQWAIWSRTTGAVTPVLSGWMDDAFDVQRRRGEKPLIRTTF